MTRTLNNYGKKENLFKDITPTGDFREGLRPSSTCALAHPQFEGQTKTKLGNSEVEGVVNTVVGEALAKYLEENPRTPRSWSERSACSGSSRSGSQGQGPSRNRKECVGWWRSSRQVARLHQQQDGGCELYLVEGDSAGGSAEGGRFRDTQAILPLRGKIINAYKSRDDKVLANEEVQSMIQAIGSGIGSDQDIGKRRYNRIIIMTDADVDGSHIRTLLLCFFYRQMYQLVAGGHVYVAQPPLYRVVRGKKEKYYVQSEDVMKTQLLEKGLSIVASSTKPAAASKALNATTLRNPLLHGDAMLTLERRGISLRAHAERMDKNRCECQSSISPMQRKKLGSLLAISSMSSLRVGVCRSTQKTTNRSMPKMKDKCRQQPARHRTL